MSTTHNVQAADAEARAAELAALDNESAEVQRHLAEHRNRIGELKQDTEAHLATAGELADAATRKEAELQAVRAASNLSRVMSIPSRSSCANLL